MKYEKRVIRSSMMAGICEIIIGLLSYWTGFGHWWFEKVGMFGYLGIGMILYAVWHNYYLIKQTGGK